MQIEMVKIGDIKPYQRNAKKHPDEQVEYIANSIKEFGFKQPLVIDKKNVLVIGHGRLLAAKKLGMEEVPCLRADDLTDEQIKALRLADNKTNESAWDWEYLEEAIKGLPEYDFTDYGFSEYELAIMNTDVDFNDIDSEPDDEQAGGEADSKQEKNRVIIIMQDDADVEKVRKIFWISGDMKAAYTVAELRRTKNEDTGNTAE